MPCAIACLSHKHWWPRCNWWHWPPASVWASRRVAKAPWANWNLAGIFSLDLVRRLKDQTLSWGKKHQLFVFQLQLWPCAKEPQVVISKIPPLAQALMAWEDFCNPWNGVDVEQILDIAIVLRQSGWAARESLRVIEDLSFSFVPKKRGTGKQRETVSTNFAGKSWQLAFHVHRFS